jgi:peptide/nickel transport system ATP-binding protein
MIFQDPASSLNPVHRIGRQIEEALALHQGLRGAAARAEARRLLDQTGIPDAGRRLDAYPHELSGGQNQRVMIAMALAGRPELLVADEPTTALDVTIQAQILDLLGALRRETGMALVLISHDLGVVADTCERVAVMYAGRIVETALTSRLFAAPTHPYTRGLLGALPPFDGPRRPLTAIPGSVPEPWAMPPGCAFAPRCPRRVAACGDALPAAVALGDGHSAACLRAVRERVAA